MAGTLFIYWSIRFWGGANSTLCLSICNCSKRIDEQKNGNFCYLFAYCRNKIMIDAMNSEQSFLAIMLFVCSTNKITGWNHQESYSPTYNYEPTGFREDKNRKLIICEYQSKFMEDHYFSQNSWKTTILSVVMPDFDPILWLYNIDLAPKQHGRLLKDILKRLSPTWQNINPVRKHRRNWSPVHHLSHNGYPWILVDSGMFCR